MKALIEAHGKIVLQLSGGKDSLACLLLAEQWWDKITVMWTNTGDAFPETIEQMARIKRLVPHFHEVKTDQPTQIRENGWPSDVVPVRATQFGHILEAPDDDAPVIQGYPMCCGANVWNPMYEAILSLGATLVIRGVRKTDRRTARDQTEVIGGITYHHPLWQWSTREVVDYVGTRGFLPKHYHSTETSLDCMHCTAYLHENAKKMRYLAWTYPHVSVEVQRRLKTIRDLVVSDLKHIERAVI